MADLEFRPNRRRLVASALALALAGCASEGSAIDVLGSPTALPPHPASPAADGARLLILPFVGIPTTTGDEIYREIRGRAEKNGLKLALRLDEPASYRVLGSFSAVTTGSGTTIVFRIDIHDPDGRRVHRYIGQEIGPTAVGDPWSGVDKKTIRHLAGRISEQLRAWITRDGA